MCLALSTSCWLNKKKLLETIRNFGKNDQWIYQLFLLSYFSFFLFMTVRTMGLYLHAPISSTPILWSWITAVTSQSWHKCLEINSILFLHMGKLLPTYILRHSAQTNKWLSYATVSVELGRDKCANTLQWLQPHSYSNLSLVSTQKEVRFLVRLNILYHPKCSILYCWHFITVALRLLTISAKSN